MNGYLLSSHPTRARAERSQRRWIGIQRIWDRAFAHARGYEVYPPAERVYRVTRMGRRYVVIFDDPTL